MKYETKQPITNNQLLYLYNSVGWYAYTKENQDLTNMVNNSLWWTACYQDNQLIGLIRCIGDGLTITYVQDLLVHPDYQRKQIGTTLLKLALDTFKSVRQFVLITDDTQKTTSFYEHVGLKSFNTLNIKGFMRHE